MLENTILGWKVLLGTSNLAQCAHSLVMKTIKWCEYGLMLLMGLYHPLDGITNLKYKLLCFLTPNKKNSKRKALFFNRDRCCHLTLCLWLIHFHSLMAPWYTSRWQLRRDLQGLDAPGVNLIQLFIRHWWPDKIS
jgi:hypothetical protein